MKYVTRDDIEHWSDTPLSKSAFPYLISKLVRLTTPQGTKINIPSGSATYIGGWDGVVTCEIETEYVPKGISLWEFGTASDVKGKADEEYEKRKKNTLGFEPKDSVFIFATPRVWSKKSEWVAEKKAENYWKDVRVYDSIALEQWLDNALPVARWFASQGGGKYPFDGIMTADEFWEEWSIGPNGLVLLPECLIAGREYERNQLLLTLQGEPTIKGVKASTKNEAIAFIVASAKMFQKEEADRFFSKTLIVDTEGNFRGIRINTNTELILIPRFNDPNPLSAAVSKRHHVLVPLGADDNFNQETITLPTIERDGQVESLIQSGISKEVAEKFSRESGRNITILKKLLKFPYYKAKWFDSEDVREIFPALLLGRWNETFVGDIELVEKLSGQKYSEYLIKLNKWKNFEESPLIQIGESWRLTSPLDLWTNLSTHLTQKDFQNIKECFHLAFKDGNPIIEPEEGNSLTAYFGKKNKYSNWSREGMSQSLILIGILDRINTPSLANPQIWIDNIILDLLYGASGELWVSVDRELPLISEASPEGFLKAVENSLQNEQPEIMEMFKEVTGLLHKTSHHSGLLWALENLAWLPEYLREVSLILLKLARLDPGGNLANRPKNSIVEIFKPWHYQTLASYDERIETLKYITQKEKEQGWNLLIRLLPNQFGVAHPIHKMRWRMFDKTTKLSYTYREIWNTHSSVIEMLLQLFDGSEEKLSQLIKEAIHLKTNDRNRIFEWAEAVSPEVKQVKFTAWHEIRQILHQHRSYQDKDWVLPENDLKKLEDLYYKLQPNDVINKYSWLFDDLWPAFPEGFKFIDSGSDKKHEIKQMQINQAREAAVIVFLKELGLNQTIELRKQVKEIRILGSVLAHLINTEEDILMICQCLNDEKNLIGFIHCFIDQKSIFEGFDWVKSLFKKLQEKKFHSRALSNLFIPLNQNEQLWEFLSLQDDELQNEYWQNMYPGFFKTTDSGKVIGITMLLKYKRFFSAIDMASHVSEVIPSDLLTEMLKKAATEEANETVRINGYEIEQVFEVLDNRTDIDRSTLIHLEWLYLGLFDSHYTKRSAKALEEELASNPAFFVEVLKCIYIPEDELLLERERAGVSDEIIQNRAKQAYHLLSSWKKIPGMGEDYSINEGDLLKWIERVRELAKVSKRLKYADLEIGKVLGLYPENISLWPQEIIFRIIELINTDSLKRGYSSSMFNKRGSSRRGIFDGGDIEREKAKYFEGLVNDFKSKYPNVAEIFKNLKQGYLADAKRMDESAERDKLDY
jgi:hypothetical protein